MDEIEELIQKTVHLPTVPVVLTRLREATLKPDPSIPDVVKILEEDQGLAAKCLQIANSAAYSMPVRCSSLRHAASVVGLRGIRQLATQGALAAAYGHLKALDGFDLTRFWKHSTVTGVVAKQIAKYSRLSRGLDVDALTSAGLLHNMGRLAMLDHYRDEYLRVIAPSGMRGPAALKAEFEAFRFDHAYVGGVLANNWKMGTEIVSAAKDHHDPNAVGAFPILVGFANEAAHAVLDAGEDGLAAAFASVEAKRLEIREEALPMLIEKIVDSAIEAATPHA